MASQGTYGQALASSAAAAVPNARFSGKITSFTTSGAAANTDITVPGIHPARDELLSVVEIRAGLKVTLVAGGAAGNLTVTGITTSDRLVSVLVATTAASIATVADLTSEFTITTTNIINNTNGTATTNNQVMVFWEDISTSTIDRTSVAGIRKKDTIRLTSTTAGSALTIIYTSRGAYSS